jgi:hypothetical protein
VNPANRATLLAGERTQVRFLWYNIHDGPKICTYLNPSWNQSRLHPMSRSRFQAPERQVSAMIAEQQSTYRPAHEAAPEPRRRRNRRAARSEVLPPEPHALRCTIRALWAKERRLGRYASAAELCQDLESLEVHELQALKGHILARLKAQIAQVRTTSPDDVARAMA